jgi:hypothetical protein
MLLPKPELPVVRLECGVWYDVRGEKVKYLWSEVQGVTVTLVFENKEGKRRVKKAHIQP